MKLPSIHPHLVLGAPLLWTGVQARLDPFGRSPGASGISYSRPDFYVDGATLPGVSEVIGDIGPSWAGLLPIDKAEPDRALYFWLVENAKEAEEGKDDLIIWFNGGE